MGKTTVFLAQKKQMFVVTCTGQIKVIVYMYILNKMMSQAELKISAEVIKELQTVSIFFFHIGLQI